MALYIGGTVNFGDNAEATPAKGDIWYNDGKFYYGTSQAFPKGWSSGGTVLQSCRYLAGCGTKTAGLKVGGHKDPEGDLDNTEEYDGTTWVTGGDLNTGRSHLGAFGTQSAAVAFGMLFTSNSEEYNGFTWASGPDVIQEVKNTPGAGTQSAGLKIAGENDMWDDVSITEEYDGTTWSTGGDVLLARSILAACGTQSAALNMGGCVWGQYDKSETEEYNGTSWSTGGDLLNARPYLGGAGTQSAGMCCGGNNSEESYIEDTEEYDGTSWSVGGKMLTGRYSHAAFGAQDAASAVAGRGLGGWDNRTEHYNEGISTHILAFGFSQNLGGE